MSFFPNSVAIVAAKFGSLLSAFANSINVSRASGAPATNLSIAACTLASTPDTALLAANAAALASSVAFFAKPVCVTDAFLAAFASSVAFFARAVWASEAVLAALAPAAAVVAASFAALTLPAAVLAASVAFFASSVCVTDAFFAAFASSVAFFTVSS